jgi:hypothetical protein
MDLIFKSYENINFHLTLIKDVDIEKLSEYNNKENILILNCDYVRICNK